MTREEAITLAVNAMRVQQASLHLLWRDWQKYGEALAFRKKETREAAELYDKLTEAVSVLDAAQEALALEAARRGEA